MVTYTELIQLLSVIINVITLCILIVFRSKKIRNTAQSAKLTVFLNTNIFGEPLIASSLFLYYSILKIFIKQ